MTLTTGIVSTSNKEKEHRLPIHPRHLDRLPPAIRPSLRFERGYGERFGVSDDVVSDFCGGLLERDEILATCELTILPKPEPVDLRQMREGAILWGWPHCVQQGEITQITIDRRLTLVAFEAMFAWSKSGARGVHVFYKNNELAGYSSVLHALDLLGTDGHYGPPRSVAVLGFGSVSRGALYALRGRGYTDLSIYTQRPAHLVRDQFFGAQHLQMRRRGEAPGMEAVLTDGTAVSLAAVSLADRLGEVDVIVNGTLQDTDNPLMYVTEDELPKLRPNSLIIDVSCDLGMGFPFAKPTGFEDPMFRAGAPGHEIDYYGVDHSPTYLWDSATWEISEALLPYLPTVMAGPDAWAQDPTVLKSVEIHQGVIQNPKILSFQKRAAEYPHPIVD